MKKNLTLFILCLFCLSLRSIAFDYVPKNTNDNPFANSKQDTKTSTSQQPEMREIKNLTEYFRYLPAEVHRNWVPYKANTNYEITVEFRVHRDGSISDTQIIGTNYPNANNSVLKAVKKGAPYQPLPKSYKPDSVKAQIILQYQK